MERENTTLLFVLRCFDPSSRVFVFNVCVFGECASFFTINNNWDQCVHKAIASICACLVLSQLVCLESLEGGTSHGCKRGWIQQFGQLGVVQGRAQSGEGAC